MKDFDEQERQISSPEIGIVENSKREFKYIASKRRIPGQTLFSFNPETQDLAVVEMTCSKIIGMDKRVRSVRQVMSYDPKLIYFWALNRKNAVRKLKKFGYIDKEI